MTDAVLAMSGATVRLTDLVDANLLETIADSLTRALGISVTFQEVDGTWITSRRFVSPTCEGHIYKTKEGERRCTESDLNAARRSADLGKSVLYECHAGFTNFAAPVVVEGQVVALIYGGQVLNKPPNCMQATKLARELGIDPNGLADSLDGDRIVSEEALQAAVDLLYCVANALANLAAERKRSEELERDRLNAHRQIAGLVAHQIGNRTFTILGGLKRLEYETRSMTVAQSSPIGSLVDRLRVDTKAIERLLRDFRNFAKPEVRRLEYLNICDLVLETVRQQLMGREDIRLKISCDVAEASALGDREMLSNVFAEVVQNALNFMPGGGDIEVRCIKAGPHAMTAEQPSKEDDFIEISITDSGPGIPQDGLEKVFQPWVTSRAQGTGLGLAIVRECIQAHGGSVTAGNARNGGATIIVRLPMNEEVLKQ